MKKLVMTRMYLDESLPDEPEYALHNPQKDAALCANYRRINLLNIAYNIISSVMRPKISQPSTTCLDLISVYF